MDSPIIMVVAGKDFRDPEYFETKEVLTNRGAVIKTASTAAEEAVGVEGGRAGVDLRFENINVEDFEAIIFVGGTGVTEYFENTEVLDLVRKFNSSGKLVAAICWASEILARAGILADKKATIWDGAKQALLSRNIAYSGEDITVDGNVITASGPAYATKFGEAIADWLKL